MTVIMGSLTKKVFIVHSSDDFGHVKKYFIDVLENELKVLCIYDGRDFIGGKSTIANIVEAVKQCYKIFVILTPSSIQKNWVKYETLLALEKSQETRHLCLTIILYGVTREEVQGQFFGVLSSPMIISVDVNKDNWMETLKSDMRQKLDEKAPMESILVNANLSVGQVWSHFTGYARIVLPKLESRIKDSSWYKQNPDRFPVVEFNLIPYSANVPQKLTDLDHRITHEGELKEICAGRGSFANRPYRVTVYSITDADGQKYFFVGQVPNTLGILKKLQSDPSEWLNPSLRAGGKQPPNLQLSSGERSLQVARFYIAFNRLVNHPKNKECNNMLRLLNYDDSKRHGGDVLLKAIKKELATEDSTIQKGALGANDTLNLDRAEGLDQDEFERTVFIDHLDDCEEDALTAIELQQHIASNGFKVWSGIQQGRDHFQILEQAMSESMWVVFILSKTAIDSNKLMTFKCRAVLHNSVDANQVRVIPLLDGINEDHVTADLRSVTHLSKQEANYKDKLLQIMKCGNIPMDSIVSAKDVYKGLAWAYVLNYLRITLDEHVEKLCQLQLKNPECCVYKKMFIIVPSSCSTKSLKSLDKNEKGEIIDQRFQQMEEIHFETKTVGGVMKRQYQLITYKLKTSQKDYIVAVEYPNSVRCLQEMADLTYLSGLSTDDIHEEASRFTELAQEIIDCSVVANKAKLLYYNDSEMKVADAMLDVLEEEFRS